MEERIDCPAYIVLDIPSPTAEWIQSVRKRFDEERSLLPAEITLTGSSGTGLIVQGQSVREISEHLDRAAEKIPIFPPAASLPLLTFPGKCCIINPDLFIFVHFHFF